MQVRRGVVQAIAEHALREYPRECCGLLLGSAAEVTESVPARNVATEPTRTYEISPEDHFAVIRRCRDTEGRVAVVGGYHSHPRSQPAPSPTDVERAFADFIYVIAGPADGGTPLDVRAYQLRHGVMEPIRFSIVD